MKLHELKNTTPRPQRQRVGRGDGSGSGRTAGRGDKGAGSRTGYSRRPFFEGGQIPLIRRIPKRGFKHPTHVEFEVINLSELNEFEAGAEVTRDALLEKGLISKSVKPLKILADGELTVTGLKVSADRFSKTAKAAIEEKGGQCIEPAAKA